METIKLKALEIWEDIKAKDPKTLGIVGGVCVLIIGGVYYAVKGGTRKKRRR